MRGSNCYLYIKYTHISDSIIQTHPSLKKNKIKHIEIVFGLYDEKISSAF